MSKAQTLRSLVSERLAAAAEDICALLERTIADYEEELSKESQRRRQLLDCVGPRYGPGELLTAGGPILSLSTHSFTIEEFKEEPVEKSLKTEELQYSTSGCVETDDTPLFQQGQTEGTPLLHKRQTEDAQLLRQEQTESGEQQMHTVLSSDIDEDKELIHPLSFSGKLMENDGDQVNQVQITDRTTTLSVQNLSAPETSSANTEAKKKYQCSVCKKRFQYKRLLEIHLQLHTGEKPYCCSVCKKKFGHLRGLKEHSRLHTGEKPFNCLMCNRAFAHSSSLTTHVRTHTGERPYHCSFCSKTFAQSSTLTIHMRTHTGERPYHCSHCNKSFYQSSALDKHMRTHTGERPYTCSLCNKAFSQMSGLSGHMVTHCRKT